MIDRDLIVDLFERTRSTCKWNIDAICLWGYFFTDHDRRKLEIAADALMKKGYRRVGFLEPTHQGDDPELLFLHVEKEEVHTIDSLDARNRELSHFAAEFDLESYDGMDVGPLPAA